MKSARTPTVQKIDGKSIIPERNFKEFVFFHTREWPDTTMRAELQYKAPDEGTTCSLITFLNFVKQQSYEYSKWSKLCKELRQQLEILMKLSEDEENDSAENKSEEVPQQNVKSNDTNRYSVHVRPVRANNREEVQEIMKKFGTICGFHHKNSCRFPVADFAFISYTTEEAQQRALNARRVSDNQDGWLIIKPAFKSVSKAQPKSITRQNFHNRKEAEEEWKRDQEDNEEHLWIIF